MNPTLERVFGTEWTEVRYGNFNGIEMHMGYDCCQVLGLSNSTNAIRGTAGICNVSPQQRIMEKVEEWNPVRTIHLLTLEGLIQMILSNKSAGCRRFKEHYASILVAEFKAQLIEEPIISISKNRLRDYNPIEILKPNRYQSIIEYGGIQL